MNYKVNNSQYISKKCFVCGVENVAGLGAKFYELENGELVGIFTPKDEHQSYPGRLHGGVSSSILDEIIGRVIMIEEPETWGVTVELNLKYKKPVPLYEPLKVRARLTRNTRLIFEGEGEILLPDGQVAVSATAKYVKMKIDKIADEVSCLEDFMMADEADIPEEIEI